MQWLIFLELENDPIAFCRLTDIFRRKDLKLVSLVATSGPGNLAVMTVVESTEFLIDHMFHFLRRTPGIRQVSYYRHEKGREAGFVFVSARDPADDLVGTLQHTVPGAKLVFAGGGDFLFEIPTRGRTDEALRGISGENFLSFTRVKTGRAGEKADTSC